MLYFSISEMCTDFVTINEHYVHVNKVTDDEAYFTDLLMRDTMDSTEPSIYRVKQEGDCGPCSMCTVWERFSSYKDFENDRPLENDAINPYIACYANTVRIYGGHVFCHTSNLTDYSFQTHMIKMNATDGNIVAIKPFHMTTFNFRDTCIEQFYKNQKTVIDYLVDRTGFWVLYKPYNSFILQQIDPEDLSLIRRIPFDIQSDLLSLTSPIIMVCGKCYFFHIDSNMVMVSKVIDIASPNISFNATTKLTTNPLYPFLSHLRPVVHFNPMSNELFLHTVNLNRDIEEYANFLGPLSMNFRFPIASCNSKFNPDLIFPITSTILWSLHQTGYAQMHQQLDILSKVNNIDEMNHLSQIVTILTTCQNPICNNPGRSSSFPCTIRQITEHLKIYSDQMQPSKNNSTVILQVSQNQRALLQQQTLRSMSNTIEEQLNVLGNQTISALLTNLDAMKDTLPDYFASLVTFDQKKANADVDFLSTRLQSFQTSISKDSTKIGKTLGKYFKIAVASTSAELAENSFRLGLAIASMFNPFKLISGGSVLDVTDAIAETAKATAHLTRAIQSMKLITRIGEEFVILKRQMNKNLRVQSNIKNMFISAIDNQLQHPSTEKYMIGFLNEYTNYDPVFTEGAFGNIGTLLAETIDLLCNLIFEGGTTSSSIVQITFAAGVGSCVNAKTDIERLLATYDEMYDFQFDLMEAMAEFVRATVSLKSAQEISTTISQKITEAEEAQNRKTKELSVRLYALQLAAANKAHVGTLVRDACNLIEYKKAGKSTEFCKDLKLTSDPRSTSYDSLVAFDYTQDMCSDDYSVKVVNIPAAVRENGTGITLPHTIDLERLYNGEEVTFQVPDRTWLTLNGWMNSEDANKANFIREFELFLPPMFSHDQPLQRESEVHISVEMVGDNQIFPRQGNRKYSFSSPTIYNLRYLDSSRCYNPVRPITNPYDTRDCAPLQQPCITSPGTMAAAVYHPSIYSRWKIRLISSGGRLRPTPSGEFFLKAGVKICHVNPSSISSAANRPARTVGGECCADQDKFYDKFGVCQPCPRMSCVKLRGYYCDRNCTSPP